MAKPIGFIRNSTALIVSLLLYASCNTHKRTPFPEDDALQPVSKTFSFSETQPLRWSTISPDSIQPPKKTFLDIDKLPAKPFTVNDFKAFREPVQQKKLDWDNIPDSAVNLDTIAVKPFTLKRSLFPKPVIVKAGMPKLMSNTTSGILQFGEEEGLPGLAVSASVVDKNGMLWLATNRGLCRYTGDFLYIYSFLNKRPQGNDHTIIKLKQDNKGRIWAATSGDGIYILDIDNGLLLHDGSNLLLSDILCDHEGNMWMTGLTDGLYFIDTKKATIKHIPAHNTNTTNPNDVLACIAEDRLHNIWTGNNKYVSIIDSSRKKVKKLSAKEGLPVGFVFNLFQDSRGDMWVGNFGGANCFVSLRDKTISTIPLIDGAHCNSRFTEDREGKIWAARDDTMYVFNKERTAVKSIVTNAEMFNQYPGTLITDSHGNIWVGTVNKNAIIIDPAGPLPEHLNSKNGLSDNNVWGVFENKNGSIWIGTYNGLNIYDPAKNQVRVLQKEQGLNSSRISTIMTYSGDSILISSATGFSFINPVQHTISTYSSGFLSRLTILNWAKDKKGHLWAATLNGILAFDVRNNSFKFLDKSSGFPSNLIWTIEADLSGNIWAGTDSGLVVIDPVHSTMKFLREKEGLCSNIVQKIVPRKNGELWVATQKGISVVDINKNTITNLNEKEGLVPDVIFDLQEANNDMYAGSVNGMIAITKPVDTAGKKSKWGFVNYGKREGFPFNDYNQNAGTLTSNGQLWWGVTPLLTVVTQLPVKDTAAPAVTVTGVNIMDQSTSFFSYRELNRLMNNNDSIWNETKTKYYSKNNLPKDSGYLAGNNIHWDSTSTLFKIPVGLVLPHDQNSLNFSFANDNVKSRDKIIYRYILEGAEKQWNEITARPNTKNYFNLSPGDYTFRVCSRGFNGVWSSPAEFSFTILPPWWQTWWAYLLYAGLLAAIVWSFAQYRSAQLKKENRVLEEKVTQRTAQLNKSLEDLKATQTQLVQSEKMASLGELTAGIAHEIQNPLNFVKNFSEVNKELLAEMNEEIDKQNFEEAKALAKDVTDNEEKIIFHAKRADAIVKGMLQHSRSSNGVKEPTNINTLTDEYLRLAYHGLRAKDKTFNATLKTEYDETIGNMNIIPQDMGRVILNLITNAFYVVAEKKKVSENSAGAENYEPTVSISTKKINGKVEIKVSDNGNGIPQKILDKIFQPFFTTKPTGQGTGLGLSLSYDIVKAHGGELKVETKENEGTEFVIIIPFA